MRPFASLLTVFLPQLLLCFLLHMRTSDSEFTAAYSTHWTHRTNRSSHQGRVPNRELMWSKCVLFWRVTVHQDNASVGFYIKNDRCRWHAPHAVVYNALKSKSLTSHRKWTGANFTTYCLQSAATAAGQRKPKVSLGHFCWFHSLENTHACKNLKTRS